MQTIYIDVLIGTNIYVTYILMLATEALIKSHATPVRRGICAFTGGVLSLIIIFPELNFLFLNILKLAIASILVFVNFGFKSIAIFIKRMIVFFAINTLFAGLMILIWFIFAPPKLIIKNSVVYYHLSPLTLIISTIIAYGVTRLLVLITTRSTPKSKLFKAEVSLNGKKTYITVFLDTGNKAFSLNGLPVVLCNAKSLSNIMPQETLICMQDIEALSSINNLKTQIIPYNTIAEKGILAGFIPDAFILNKDNKRVSCSCIIAPVFKAISDGEADAIAGEALFDTEEILCK